jgi:hypothetical protein
MPVLWEEIKVENKMSVNYRFELSDNSLHEEFHIPGRAWISVDSRVEDKEYFLEKVMNMYGILCYGSFPKSQADSISAIFKSELTKTKDFSIYKAEKTCLVYKHYEKPDHDYVKLVTENTGDFYLCSIWGSNVETLDDLKIKERKLKERAEFKDVIQDIYVKIRLNFLVN